MVRRIKIRNDATGKSQEIWIYAKEEGEYGKCKVNKQRVRKGILVNEQGKKEQRNNTTCASVAKSYRVPGVSPM